MSNTSDVYGQIATEGAKMIWQTAGSVLTQIGILFAASKVGSISNRLMGNRNSATPASPRQTSRFNPLPYISQKIPSMLSWFTAEAVVDEYKDTLGKPWQKLAPIGEGFLKPLVEKTVTPFLDFLQNKGLMQIPQPVVEKVCEVCPDLKEMVTETVKQAAMPEETGSTGLLSALWERLNQPIIRFGSQATEIIPDNLPSKMEQVFSTPEVVKSLKEVIKPAVKPVIEQAHEAAKHIPTGYIAKAGQHAETAGRLLGETFSGAFDLANKAIHKPADVMRSAIPTGRYVAGTLGSAYDKSAHFIHAVDDAAGVIADAMGVHRAWIIGAGIGITSLAGYSLFSGLHSIYNRNTAAATAHAAATGGQGLANGNTLNLQINLPPQQPVPVVDAPLLNAVAPSTPTRQHKPS